MHGQFENVAIETPFEAAIACSLTIHSLLLRMTRVTNRVCSALGSNYPLFEHALHDNDTRIHPIQGEEIHDQILECVEQSDGVHIAEM